MKKLFLLSLTTILYSNLLLLLSELFKTGNLLLDLRLHEKETSARNHGTAFRTFEDKLPSLFQRVEDI